MHLKKQYFYRALFTIDHVCTVFFGGGGSNALSLEIRNFHALAKVIAQ